MAEKNKHPLPKIFPQKCRILHNFMKVKELEGKDRARMQKKFLTFFKKNAFFPLTF